MTEVTGLTSLQIEIMDILWERGESTVHDVQKALSRTRKLAQPTVATLLTRLEKRGAITHRVEGRQFVYSARLARNAVRKSIIAEITNGVFGGDAPALVSQLLEERGITHSDLADMKAMIAAKERELAKESKPRKKP
jgi:predicted transcriptional regulator